MAAALAVGSDRNAQTGRSSSVTTEAQSTTHLSCIGANTPLARLATDLIRSITDPEHPLTLEQLAVVSAPQITITNGSRPHVLVEFTPTIPHCSMATLIGLSLRVRLLRALPLRYKVDIKVKRGTHQSENAGERRRTQC